MDAFPAYFPLTGRTVVIVGEGEAAQAKVRLFEGSPAIVVRVDESEAAADPKTYAGAALVFIAVADAALAARGAQAARAAHVPVNVTDRPALSDFFTPAVIDRGQVVVAVGTGGASPVLASLLRGDIEARVPEGAGRLAALLGRMQEEVRGAVPDLHRRRAFLRGVLSGPAADAALAGDMAKAETLLRKALVREHAGAGTFCRIDGRGPAEGLSLKAARILGEADVAILDAGVDSAVTALVRRDARRLAAAEVATGQVAELVRQGMQVVHLIGDHATDDEIGALAELGVTCEPAPD